MGKIENGHNCLEGLRKNEVEKNRSIYVMKFGGTSVGGGSQIERVSQIVKSHVKDGQAVVVVASAMSGITNRLVAICDADIGDISRKDRELRTIFDIHLTAASQLKLSLQIRTSLVNELRELFIGLRRDINSIGLSDAEKKDRILSYGERMSVRLISAKLNQEGIRSEVVSSSEIIKTDNLFGEAKPDVLLSEEKAEQIVNPLLRKGVTPVITGFLGSTQDGRVTTLGRGGSDFSASFIGRLLGAKEVWIWTDVDGVFTSDPRYNSNAHIIDRLTYIEADRMAKNGAKVLHYRTLEPLFGTEIVLRVKNTFNPTFRGTTVVRE